MCIWCLFTTQFSLVILSQISVACSESWYWKLEFCVTSFWFYYHRLWWSSWHAMLALFLLYIFLVRIFSWHMEIISMVGVTSSRSQELRCSLHNLFSAHNLSANHALFCQLHLFCSIVGWHHLMPFCCALAFICFWLNLIVQFTSEFNLSCTDLCKVSTEDSDHVMS